MGSAPHLQEADSQTGALRSDVISGVLGSIPLPECRDPHLTRSTFGAKEKGMSGTPLSGSQPVSWVGWEGFGSPAATMLTRSSATTHPTRFSFFLLLQ